MKAMKNVFALCLALILVVGCLPVTGVLAAGGTAATPEAGDITIPIIPVKPVPPQQEEKVVTDLNGDGDTNTSDAVYLLLNAMFGETDYPLPAGVDADYNSSGEVDTSDAVYLLLYVMFGEADYPLYPAAA